MTPDELLSQLRLRAAAGDPLTHIVTAQEVLGWPLGTLETALADRLLVRSEPEQLAECPECGQHWDQVKWVRDRAIIVCPAAGPVVIDPEVLQRWRLVRPRFDGYGASTPGSKLLPETPPDAYLFRRVGEYWDLRFASSAVIRVHHLKGLADISRLLRVPDEFVAAIDLMAGRGAPGGIDSVRDDGLHPDSGRGVPLADVLTIQALKDRLVEIELEMNEAREAGELDDIERLTDEKQQSVAYLVSVTDDEGGPRLTGGPVTNARTAVSNRITTAIARIRRDNAGLADHLDRYVERGTWLRYKPDRPIPWAF